MDKLTKEQRHRCMSAIKSKNTKPELLVRKFLFSRGFRYRLNHPRLPGHPDLVLRKYRTVIFVNGCFWHGHEGCKYYVLPKTNVEFWKNKIERNRRRDREVKPPLLHGKSIHITTTLYTNGLQALHFQSQLSTLRESQRL